MAGGDMSFPRRGSPLKCRTRGWPPCCRWLGQHGLYGISADGVWSCSILRLPEPAALFAVAQRAVEQVLLEESLVEENVGFLSESLPSGNAIRIGLYRH